MARIINYTTSKSLKISYKVKRICAYEPIGREVIYRCKYKKVYLVFSHKIMLF